LGNPEVKAVEAIQGEQDRVEAEKRRWEETTWSEAVSKVPERLRSFTTVSNRPIEKLYTPADVRQIDYLRDIGFPGEYPFTRGVQTTMYRGRLWTMRLFSGYGTAVETNRRYKYLLEQGQTGLSVAFHLPTIMGYDSDDPRSLGEVGKCGVAIDSLADMETLFDGIPLDKITTSMTINAPAAVLLAMYQVVAEKQGVDARVISGTIQNDLLKEYIAQKSYIFPPRPSMRLIIDTFEYCSKYLPRWNFISISGYHIREAGASAVQELAFTLADGIEYVRCAVERGLEVDSFAPRLSFFFNAHNDFFEEVAKFRAARRIWARVMRERFKAKNPRSWWLRFHTQTAGCTLTAQQPLNNIVRVAIQALAAVLGGTQSLHTNAMDETLALPTEEAATVALRTQQIIAHESGVTNTIDPLAGSYFVERLTSDMEEGAMEYIKKIDDMGGMMEAIERGYPQAEIQNQAYWYQKAVESGEKTIVGVNKFAVEEQVPIEVLKIGPEVAEAQARRLSELRRSRDSQRVSESLQRLKRAAEGSENLMPFILEAVRCYATNGEIIGALREVFGEYIEPRSF